MDLLIVYEGQRVRTGAIARTLASRASRGDVTATVVELGSAGGVDVAHAAGLVVGCHARIDTPFGGDAAKPMLRWISELPELRGMPVAVFCTYRFFPNTFADATTRTAEVLRGLESACERRGGAIVSSHAVNRRHPDDGIDALVSDLHGHLVA